MLSFLTLTVGNPRASEFLHRPLVCCGFSARRGSTTSTKRARGWGGTVFDQARHGYVWLALLFFHSRGGLKNTSFDHTPWLKQPDPSFSQF